MADSKSHTGPVSCLTRIPQRVEVKKKGKENLKKKDFLLFPALTYIFLLYKLAAGLIGLAATDSFQVDKGCKAGRAENATDGPGIILINAFLLSSSHCKVSNGNEGLHSSSHEGRRRRRGLFSGLV